MGLIVPKHKQTAVARNRVKRRLRECARLELLPALRLRAEHEAPLDVVLRAAPSAYQAGGPDLCADVRRIAARLGGASGAMSGAVSGAVSGAAGRTTTGTAPRGAS